MLCWDRNPGPGWISIVGKSSIKILECSRNNSAAENTEKKFPLEMYS